jgi:hypothetical protein
MATVVLMTALRRAGIDQVPDRVLLDQPDVHAVPVIYAERPPLATLNR